MQLAHNCSTLFLVCNTTVQELNAKLSEKHAALVNMAQRYNQCASQFNRLYEEHQKLQADYDDMARRFNIFISIALAGVAALGLFAIRVSVKHDKLVDEYNSLVEELERLEEGEKR
jgi:hypothetical protein